MLFKQKKDKTINPLFSTWTIVEDKHGPVAQLWKGLIVSSLIWEGISDGPDY